MRSGFLVLLALLLLLPGCWSRIEINDLGLVLGIGVDVGEEERVRLTLYFARTQGLQQEAKAVGGDPVWVVSREGENLNAAMREISMAAARRITLHHVRVVLIGEEFARVGLRGMTDFLARNPQVRLSLRPMVVRGRAQTVLETMPQLKALQPDNLVAILQARGGVEWSLKEFLVARVSETHSGWMHAVEVIPRPAGTPGAPPTATVINGAALFRGDRLVELLEMREAQILSWLLGNPKGAVISATCPDEPEHNFSARVDQGKAHIRPVRGTDGLRLEVRITGKLDLIRMGCAESVLEPAQRRRLERHLGDHLCQSFLQAIERFQESGTDPVGFGKRVQMSYPAYWNQIAKRWPEIWPEVPVNVSGDIVIYESGLLIRPADRMEQELEPGD